ncbi:MULTISPECIES: phage tail tip lysozyme [unclassified Lactococcus]|uniref:phage tail tip lysozyme n=1 Tax=unclassified Lactococcus TaxID=2643510 RepID=UPI001430DFF6|nr:MULTISPECIES: phage tail tip lysozyme [unclassified Lactococcus]KAF6609690.1 peptidoglycan DD-metalloendopeptidase family protein [Lactococcus sp. EKM201L]KAF6613698.1 peptidoglycan DD-metalloendopeptidase family protein [Lactococcus sp. EKM203L]KAF6640675.1 peptidoglycan DD-metalloendopeptidase family protein [Lactococcus sp. EKM501L]KAF6645939.1 peptidoglycan DD-metalloendopeptidase family protein [Lactococcus sp. EKM502L]KAF6651639.1 peptidoglycan DD-metalloendopeptidase family protein [
MIRKIYLYDKMPEKLEENGIPIIDWKDLPEITRSLNNSFSFYGNYLLNGNNVKKIKKEKYIKAFTENGTYQYFRIKSVKKNLNGISITALHIGYEANRNFIPEANVTNGNGKQIMNALKSNLVLDQPFLYESDVASYHQFTAKQVNPIDAIIGSNNGNQNLAGVCDAELDMDNYTLTLKERIGEDNGFRIDFGKNLASIEETVDDSAIVNRLFLVGGVPDDTDYNVEQDPVTFGYLSVSGVTEENVQIAKRENSECKTVEDLKKWGQTLFDNDRIHEPKVTHEVDMAVLENTLEYQKIYQKVASLKFGDTAYISLKNLDIQVQERMIEYTWYPTLAKYKSVVLGNDLEMYTSSIETQVNSVNKKIETKSDELINAVNNASQWITGNKGGYVLLDPKDAPRRILIMDKPNAADAKKVWQWNVDGLGYSSTGINGKYGLAMTRDGAIVADFITAGVLSGIKIRSVNNDFIIELYDGKIRFIKKDGSSEKEMFAFAPTYVGGQLQGINAIQNQGYSFALSSMGSNGAFLNVLEIPKDSTADNRKLNLYGDVKVKGNFYVNDVKIDTNGGGNSGGGGGWNGQYPPEVTSDRDKRYWQIWAMAIGAGFSKQAAAALLGNAQGESDANPTADESGGRPGFGYGVWQWTDSSGASSGRVYMINLMTRAGVTDNPDTITAQFKLLMWHAPNGQWIATSSYPYSWTQFMTLTDINTATQAFVSNFERPLVPHPERSTWAQEWFNKFVNLEIPSGGSYIAPIASPITVTSEMGWRTSPITGAQEFHNAIDLVNGNPTTPILASGDGQVVQAGSNYYDWYGNYTVIKHADGLYTGYAHQSRIDVSVGQNVKKGQQIGLMGATGPVTGPHLHFQFMDEYWPSSNAHFKNPRDYIKF